MGTYMTREEARPVGKMMWASSSPHAGAKLPVGQVRMDPGARACPSPDKGEMADTGMFVAQGTSLLLEPARVEHRGGIDGSGSGGGGHADLGEAVSLGWHLASRYRVWHQSHLRTAASTLPHSPSPSPSAHPHTPRARRGDQQILAVILSNIPAPPRPEKRRFGELLFHHQRNCGRES